MITKDGIDYSNIEGVVDSIETYSSGKIVWKGNCDDEDFKKLMIKLRDRFVDEFNKDREVHINAELLNSGKVPIDYWNRMEEGKLSFEQAIREIAAYVDEYGVKNG